jgi:hypothetical protein
MLGDDGEDTGREGHVEDTVGLGAVLLNLLESLVESLERLVLVILTGFVCAELAEVLELLLNLLGRGLHVGLDPPQVLLVVHLCAGISDNLTVLG